MYWNPVPQSDGSVNYTATQVELSLTPGSAPVVTYTDGIMNVNSAQGLTQYTASNTDTGTIVTGAKGRVEVDVPLVNIGNPTTGKHLLSINAQSAAATAALGFIADQAAASKDYIISSASCLPKT